MGFDSGSIAYTRFTVVGDVPRLPTDELLEKFASLAMKTGEETTSEIDYAWCGPQHVLDADFSVGNLVYNDCLTVGLRVDTNKVPAEMQRAYLAMEVAAVAKGNPSGFASKIQKRQAKETAARQIDDDLASGKYRRTKMMNILWDLPAGIVYAPVGGATREQLTELFERTHNLQLDAVSSGTLAMNMLDAAGRRRLYEDIVPTRFAVSDMQPEYPWTAKGMASKDFIGNEFLMWLWHEAGTRGGEVQLKDGPAVTVMFTSNLTLDCSFGTSGRTTLKLEVPTEMAEAFDALRSGKVPRVARLTAAIRGELFQFAIGAESLAISGLKLPEVDKADSARVLFEERITLLRDLNRDLDALFWTFLDVRASERWPQAVSEIRQWLAVKPTAAAA